MNRRRLIACLLVLQSWALFAQEGALLYAGSTEADGWQVFRYDFATRKSTQLSFSPGDKRNPQYNPGLKAVTCRDSLGRVLRLSGRNESPLSTNLDGCANYSITADGRRIYFTRPSVEKRRQDIWVQRIPDGAPEVAVSVPDGMLKQVAVSSDGKWLAATHIWRVNEERLVLVPAGEGKPVEYLTKDKSMDAFPAWTADGCILFCMTTASGTYAVHKICPPDKKIETVTFGEGFNECSPSSDRTGRFVFFERRTSERTAIVSLDTRTHETKQLELPHEAREPFWYENN